MTDSREHLDISILQREVDRLAAAESGWATWDPEDRVAFRAEWHDLMDVFTHVLDAYDRGRLAEDDAGEFAQ